MITVIQPGARLHYAAPAALARAGLLSRLITDLHGERAWMRALGALPAPALRRLAGRRLPAELRGRTKDLPARSLARAAAGQPAPTAAMLGLLARDARPGDTVYTALVNEDLEAMAALKARGVRIVHEAIQGPDVGLILAEEARRFPRLGPAPDAAAIAAGRRRDRAKLALADLVLAPSRFAARAIRALAPEARLAVVPYGLELSRIAGPAAPVPGRVLFVGQVGLRKGAPDLAAAARRLGRPIRAVGPVAPAALPALEGLDLVGPVPRAAIAREFLAADVFAFPTLCDSFGLVLLEAMAAGVPVVCTPNCGDVVRDGIEGFVVPPRDPAALAEALARITGDRALRARMSAAARARLRGFSAEAYQNRLAAVLGPLATGARWP